MDFYLVIAPGLEVQTLAEMKEVWPYLIGKDGQAHNSAFPKYEMDRGGIEFSCDEILAYQLNFFLKTPTRLLQRIKRFRTRDFPKVFQEISKVPWNQLLNKELSVELHVSAQKSRLNNEKRLSSVLEEVLLKNGCKVEKEAPQAIYLRMDNDDCTLSIDTTGEMLYKRGWGLLKGEAPMRETLAAFAIRELIFDSPLPKTRQICLLDPFCGSGTLLLEAASLYAPHWQRRFSFNHFPSCPKIFKSDSWRKNFRLLPNPIFKSYVGNDLSSKVLEAARQNSEELERQLLEVHGQWVSSFKWHHGPCGGLTGAQFLKDLADGDEVWMVSNPPYGDRVQLGADGGLLQQILRLLGQGQGRITRLALLLPPEEAQALHFQGFEKTKEIPLSNGGLKTVWTVWCKI